jgi:hypothetical protein
MNLMLKSTAAAAIASVAAPAAMPAALPEAAPVAPIGPTQIDLLFGKRRLAIREYDRLKKHLAELEAEVARRMPAPHPSILYGSEQDADGLKWPLEDRPPLDKFIWPHFIRAELNRAKYGIVAEFSPTMIDTLDKAGGPSLTGNQAALVERLTARLKLSEQYMRKWKQVKARVGVTALVDKMDKLADRQSTIESRIASAKPVTRSDMARKLALYDSYKREFYGEEIIRDLRKLFAGEIILAA